ncbi:DUF4260 domain-containing protein [Nostoc ellipsosporum NOK]|jgi:hypothetical protein|nr:DUF4260 domain-containing protein [Nostoc ellipsosporum NOK]
MMKQLIQIEEFCLLVLSIAALAYLGCDWWIYLLLVFGPDISMLGYLAGNKTGAFTYNLFHHKGVAIVLITLGWYLKDNTIMIAGIVLFGHSSMDRVFGYGLKTNQGFNFTHLGTIGNKNK